MTVLTTVVHRCSHYEDNDSSHLTAPEVTIRNYFEENI